ncbi:MAG TPA: hypothetical protein VK437_15485, partial [Steroidobacteraceae bacterium]|nr:hypothetical protein [Steroidobacteraceae bacterium]
TLPSGAIPITATGTPPFVSSSGSLEFSLSADLIMDPASDSYTLALTSPSDGGLINTPLGAAPVTFSGAPGTVQTDASTLAYTPSAGTCVNLDVTGASISAASPNVPCKTTGAAVSFDYTLSDTSVNPATSSATSGTINIQALTGFTQSNNPSVPFVYNILQGNTAGANSCATNGCHGSPTFNYWMVGATAQQTYTNIQGATSLTGHPLVIAGDPAHSALYTGPCLALDPYPEPNGTAVSMGTTPAAPLGPASSASCLALYQWILEGAQLD